MCLGGVISNFSTDVGLYHLHADTYLSSDVLQLLGLLITYFLLVVQMSTPIDSAAASDVTTVAMETVTGLN